MAIRTSRKTRRSRARGLLLGLFVFLSPAFAWAFPAEVQTVAKVSLGKNPTLMIQVTEPAERAVVSLKRGDGKKFTFPLGNLVPGTVREIKLDGRLGRHSYQGEMTAVVEGAEVSSPLQFETVVAAPLQIEVKRSDLDLGGKVLRIKTSRQVDHVTLRLIGLSGEPIEEKTFAVTDWQKGTPIVLRWKHAEEDELVRLEVRVEDKDGFFNAVSLTPWSVEIPHEEVLFDTGSANIEASEESKLEESLERIQDALKRYSQIKGVGLFIAGHTDTQGGAASNLNLSRSRARAIGAWFVNRGLTLKISFEGFGESSLRVQTEDEVDEPKNRRVDYILSVEAPPLKGGSWKRLN